MTKPQNIEVDVDERRPETRRTRQMIIDRAAEQFALWGYDGASIGDISAAAGLSKPALYYHFHDKEDLYLEVVTNVLASMIEGARSAVSGASLPSEQLRRFMLAHAEYFQKNEYAYVAAQLGFRGLRKIGKFERAAALRDEYEAILFDVIDRGRRGGNLQMTDSKSATFMVLSILNWMARWYRTDGGLPATEFADRYCTMLLSGLAVPNIK